MISPMLAYIRRLLDRATGVSPQQRAVFLTEVGYCLLQFPHRNSAAGQALARHAVLTLRVILRLPALVPVPARIGRSQ